MISVLTIILSPILLFMVAFSPSWPALGLAVSAAAVASPTRSDERALLMKRDQIDLPGKIAWLGVADDGGLLIRLRDDAGFVRVGADREVTSDSSPAGGEDPRRTVDGLNPLPDGQFSEGATGSDIRFAWYGGPTGRYAHGVLGDRIEAGALVVDGGAGSPRTVRLPETDVFEDLTPRVVDLDGDGVNEIVTIRSSVSEGGSIAVYQLRGDGLELLGRTPSIGQPNRWMNVAAIEDFDGDGVLDLAIVETPHIGGILKLWSGGEMLQGRATLLARQSGVSNHAIGSRELDLSEPVRRDGELLLAIPDVGRDRLRLLQYTPLNGGMWLDRGSLDLTGRVATAIVPFAGGVAVGLEDGRLMTVTLP